MRLRTFPPLTLVLAVFGVTDAQITLHSSLGRAGSLIGPNYTISSNLGQILGSNLFPSFGLFNAHTGERAPYTGPTRPAFEVYWASSHKVETRSGSLQDHGLHLQFSLAVF